MTSSAASEPVVRSPRGRAASLAWVAAAMCAVAGGALFQFFGNANHGYINTSSLFWWWGFQWCNAASETQHGWGILAVAVWLGWRNLRTAERPRSATESSRLTDRGSPLVAPLVAMLGGLGLHAVGFVGQQARVSILGLLLFIWGVLRLGGGRRWGEATAFPVTFLVFAIPVNVLDSVGFWLRLWVVDAGGAIAHAVGIAVVQSGTLIMAPDGRYCYDVSAACSGVRSLAALAALSLVLGYLSFLTWRRRLVILLLAVPLVYVGNVARIVAIVFAAHLGGARWGEVAHTLMGYAVFAIVVGGAVAGAVVIRRFAPEPVAAGGKPDAVAMARPEQVADESAPTRRVVVVAMIVMVAIGVTAGFLQRVSQMPSRGGVGVVLAADGKNPVELPAFLGREWMGWPAPITGPEREILPPDTGYSRINYFAMNPLRSVFVSIVLSGRDRTSIHRPELCLVGQGWPIRGYATHRFAYPGTPGATVPATILRVDRRMIQNGVAHEQPQLVAYWFVNSETVVASNWDRMMRDAWNRVAHGKADRWAYVLVQTDAADGETAALARLQTVLNATLPTFQKVYAQVPQP